MKRKNLKRRKMSSKEIGSRNKLMSKLSTNLGSSQTRPYLPPILIPSDMISQPRRETLQPVLLEPHTAPSDGVRAVRARDHEGEDEDHEQQHDEDEHGDEVDGEEAFLLPVGADESGGGDEEEGEAEEDERPAEPLEALVVRPRRQPHAGCDDGEGAHHRHEVEDRRDVVAHRHDCVCGRVDLLWEMVMEVLTLITEYIQLDCCILFHL